MHHDELGLIHKIAAGETIEVGTLQLDQSLPAYINFEELLRKHFAVLGTTGVGKSTMRMANDRDQAIVKAAVADAGVRQLEFLSSLGTREAIAFGEGVALPTRIRFKDLATEFVPRSQSRRKDPLGTSSKVDRALMQSVVHRWRQTTITGPRSTGGSGTLDAEPAAATSIRKKILTGEN